MDCSGVSIFDLETFAPVSINSIKTKKNQSYGVRLKYIEDEITKLTEKYPPSIIAIERGFSRFNTSTQVIYRVHGVVNKYFHNVQQIYYPPKTVKEAIIRGDATKKLIHDMICAAYPNVQFDNEDESDAFAVALCWLIKNDKIVWEKEKIKMKLKNRNTK